ncbi:unnamed protein product [Vitrella brassicaformis CCMP3155]|uniref:Uncharacterized protein n=1 Tax=Vitrella brassicaformis (strain CCMP3155) TaxID=1169540 RepID=A0A0G4EG18_VITBC|nr:unnamed protein product [Vitrella brassicaformis CCMP3155]|eukprot:CEL94391.1 unnamed protein product [Vitrella brassicaformis CCMP3155]
MFFSVQYGIDNFHRLLNADVTNDILLDFLLTRAMTDLAKQLEAKKAETKSASLKLNRLQEKQRKQIAEVESSLKELEEKAASRPASAAEAEEQPPQPPPAAAKGKDAKKDAKKGGGKEAPTEEPPEALTPRGELRTKLEAQKKTLEEAEAAVKRRGAILKELERHEYVMNYVSKVDIEEDGRCLDLRAAPTAMARTMVALHKTYSLLAIPPEAPSSPASGGPPSRPGSKEAAGRKKREETTAIAGGDGADQEQQEELLSPPTSPFSLVFPLPSPDAPKEEAEEVKDDKGKGAKGGKKK